MSRKRTPAEQSEEERAAEQARAKEQHERELAYRAAERSTDPLPDPPPPAPPEEPPPEGPSPEQLAAAEQARAAEALLHPPRPDFKVEPYGPGIDRMRIRAYDDSRRSYASGFSRGQYAVELPDNEGPWVGALGIPINGDTVPVSVAVALEATPRGQSAKIDVTGRGSFCEAIELLLVRDKSRDAYDDPNED